MTARDEARSNFFAIRRVMIALGRPATAAEIAEQTELALIVVTRRLQANSTSNARPDYSWFAKGLSGWELTARGREAPED